jgi:hypothetical protein
MTDEEFKSNVIQLLTKISNNTYTSHSLRDVHESIFKIYDELKEIKSEVSIIKRNLNDNSAS